MVAVEAFAAGDFEPPRVEAELLQHRGVQVGDVVPILDSVEAKLVRRAMHNATLNAAATKANGKSVRMMIAAVGTLRAGRAAEFGGEDHKRFVKHSALLQIAQ